MKGKSLFIFWIFVFVSSFMSCVKECPKPPEEIQACEMDIDKSIKFDTLWNINVENASRIKYFDKYIVSSDSDKKEYNFYSAETGELLKTVDANQFEESYFFRMQIAGDYACAFGAGLKPVITKYNILTDEIQISDSLEYGRPFIFKEDYFYYSTRFAILKNNYKGETLDTILKYNEDRSFFDIYGMLATEKYIISVYNDRKQDVMRFLVVDIDKKKVKDNLVFSLGHWINDFNIMDNLVNVSCDELKFSYNLNTSEYFVNRGDKLSETGIYSISNVHLNENQETSVILFYSNDYMNAYDFYSGDLLWKCNGQSVMMPIHIKDSKGKEFTYLARSNKDAFSLIEPNTGVIKAFSKRPFSDIKNHSSNIYNNDSTLILKSIYDVLTKIKIVKE